jgi:hypothetical protein
MWFIALIDDIDPEAGFSPSMIKYQVDFQDIGNQGG